MERGYLSNCRNSETNCLSVQNFTKIGQSARTDLRQETIFNMAVVRCIVGLFFKFSYLVTLLSSSSKSAVVYQISSKLSDFPLRYGN